MKPLSSQVPSLQYELIGNILGVYPQMARTIERYFGGHCLERPGFKIQTLGMACILSGIDQERLLQELAKLEHEGPKGQYPTVYIKPNKSLEDDEEKTEYPPSFAATTSLH